MAVQPIHLLLPAKKKSIRNSILNHVIVERLRLMRQIRAHGAMIHLRIGQRVRFTSSRGEMVRGIITRHNRKSVTLVTDAGMQWRVAPELLQTE